MPHAQAHSCSLHVQFAEHTLPCQLLLNMPSISLLPLTSKHVASSPAWPGSHLRAAATVGGHMALFRARWLQSNLVPVLMALDATVGVATLDNGTR